MVYLDIETLDFFSDEHIKSLPRDEQLRAMRLGCAVTYNADDGCWKEWAAREAMALWLYADSNAPVVGWNVDGFDMPVVYANSGFSSEMELPESIDLFAQIRKSTGRWYKLEDICQVNLGRGKLADGQKAAEWLRSGDPELVHRAIAYCRHDVELVVSLHSRLLSGEPLRLPPRPQRQELNELLWNLASYERLPDAMGAISTK